MSDQMLRGRVALITGASRGLGQEVAYALAAHGASLALAARDTAALEATATTAQAAAGPEQQVCAYPTNLADPAEVDALATQVLHDFGAVDILVNNAALQGQIGPFIETDWSNWQKVIQVNLLAPARLCQLLIPTMRERGAGKIINLSGGGATGPRPDFSAYATAKCALVRLSETLAEELRGTGIDINSIAPGALNTRMLEELLAAGPDAAPREYARALKQAEAGGTPLATPVALIVWLASAASDGISGRLISAVWDPWQRLPERREQLMGGDIYTLRRIVPEDRGQNWS